LRFIYFEYTRTNAWNEGVIIALFSGISVALFVVTLVFAFHSFRNEIYEDRGYLTFTIPISGREIVISKLITTIIWFAIASIISFIFINIFIKVLFDQNMMKAIDAYINTKAVALMSVLFSLVNLIMLLLMIYFSITITRVAFKRKKLSKALGFVIFIVLNIIIFYIQHEISSIFPQTISFHFDFLKNSAQLNGEYMNIDEQAMISIRNSSLDVNIAAVVYSIAVYIGLFLGTGYLIDNSIDI